MIKGRRREPEVPQAPIVLDAKGQALSVLMAEMFADRPEVKVAGAADEVTIAVSPNSVSEICNVCRDDPRLEFNYLRCLCVVDYHDRLEVNYHLFSLKHRHKMVVKTSVSPDEAVVPSVMNIWSGADWFEREGHDLFGVVFSGHPNLVPLLLYEGFEGFPGRKSFPLHDYDEW
ncbi:NADH-quinone oxidoreductase subunit C [Dehalococcoidia bacterium]|nr:NADH-quinone oxidoreductase subunit C [Dehalococcoidia bacterium]